jgi:phage baseplate assembly protein W
VTDIIGSGLAFPLRLDRRGGIALVHGEADIQQAIQIILGTAPGDRPMRPEFGCGVHEFVFDSIDANMLGRVEQAVRYALERWEPRIRVQAIDFDLEQAADGRLGIVIGYEVRSTNVARNLVYPFYVIPAEEME